MKRIKSNRGVSIADLIIALLILTMFSGIIGNLLYQIAYNNTFLRMNAVAVEYAVKVAEDIDKKSYEEVTNDLNNNAKENYKMLEAFDIEIDVENYNKDNEEKQDIIKMVDIKIKYSVLKDEKTYTIRKLKVKEI